MVDPAVLATVIDNPGDRYEAAVVSGNNGEVLRLLSESTTGTKRFNNVTAAELLDVIAGENLTPAQDRRVDQFIRTGRVDLSRPGISTAIMNMISAPAQAALRALAERDPTVVEESAVGEAATLNDVRKAVRRVAKSHIVATGQADLET